MSDVLINSVFSQVNMTPLESNHNCISYRNFSSRMSSQQSRNMFMATNKFHHGDFAGTRHYLNMAYLGKILYGREGIKIRRYEHNLEFS